MHRPTCIFWANLTPFSLQAVHAAAKQLVVVLIGGRPIAEPWVKDNCDAVIASMCGGQAQGTAIANIISGKYNPSGRLPITWPRSAATLPSYYSFPNGGHPGSWWDVSAQKATEPGGLEPEQNAGLSPLWIFGHGESYTRFTVRDLPGRLSALSVFPSKSVLYGVFV
jgi:beta-glucosidase